MSIEDFNYIEAGLWFMIAVLLLIAAFRQSASGRYFRVFAIASIWFALFAVSDLVEAQTGAWWRPFWLLLLKAVCVAAFIVSYLWYQSIQRAKA